MLIRSFASYKLLTVRVFALSEDEISAREKVTL